MILNGRKIKVFVCKEPTDMRASYDSLAARAKNVLKKDPFCGHLFLFVNKRRSSCKALLHDGSGFVIVSKRLDKGRFSLFNPRWRGELILTSSEYTLFLEGASLDKRFIESPRPARVKPLLPP